MSVNRRVQGYLQDLTNQNEDVRLQSVIELGQEGRTQDDEGRHAVVEGLWAVVVRGSQEDEFVRRAAVMSIGEIGGDHAWHLLELAVRDTNQGNIVCEEAAIALARSGDEDARRRLVHLARANAGKPARWAHRALRRYGEREE